MIVTVVESDFRDLLAGGREPDAESQEVANCRLGLCLLKSVNEILDTDIGKSPVAVNSRVRDECRSQNIGYWGAELQEVVSFR